MRFIYFLSSLRYCDNTQYHDTWPGIVVKHFFLFFIIVTLLLISVVARVDVTLDGVHNQLKSEYNVGC